ncbi:MAG: sigma-70 family RNA polymerase sigma factor [Acidobacteriota bacterium]
MNEQSPWNEDAELVAAARAGSQEAYRQLLLRFQRPVYSLIARMVRDPVLAEDLAQETFVKAFRKLDRYDPQRKFSSWLFKVAHNTTLDHMRRRSLALVALENPSPDEADLASVLVDDSQRAPDELAQRGDLAQALESAVGALRSEYREIVVLRYQEGLAYQEIAEITGLPMGTVKTHLHRARKELMAILQGQGWGHEGIVS